MYTALVSQLGRGCDGIGVNIWGVVKFFEPGEFQANVKKLNDYFTIHIGGGGSGSRYDNDNNVNDDDNSVVAIVVVAATAADDDARC